MLLFVGQDQLLLQDVETGLQQSPVPYYLAATPDPVEAMIAARSFPVKLFLVDCHTDFGGALDAMRLMVLRDKPPSLPKRLALFRVPPNGAVMRELVRVGAVGVAVNIKHKPDVLLNFVRRYG